MTEDLALRDQLVHSERLSAIGELIAGVAHEINNPLQTIIGCTELMLDEPDGRESARSRAGAQGGDARGPDRAQPAGVRAPRRRPIARRSTSTTSSARPPSCATTTCSRSTSRSSCAVRRTPLPVAVNREEIRQVILNLLLNAEHAIASSTGERNDHRGDLRQRRRADGRGDATAARGSVPSCAAGSSSRSSRRVKSGRAPGSGCRSRSGSPSAHGGTLALVDSPSGARFRLTLPAARRRCRAAERSPAPASARSSSTTTRRFGS